MPGRLSRRRYSTPASGSDWPVHTGGCGHLEAFLRTELALPIVRQFLASSPIRPDQDSKTP
jgi:hypothetical protein